MASYTRLKNACATCDQAVGMFTCRGCLKNFCSHHTLEHRRALEQQMNEIIHNHNTLNDTLNLQSVDENYLHLKEEIEKWENQSIRKIRQTAEGLRQELENLVEQQRKIHQEKLAPLSEELTIARESQDFFEQDLLKWTEKLNKLRLEIIDYKKIRIEQSQPLISKINLNRSAVQQALPVVYHHQHANGTGSNSFYSDRSTNLTMSGEYRAGDQLFRFKVGSYKSNSLLLIGIISAASTNIEDPRENSTFYGWGNDSMVYIQGVGRQAYDDYQSDIQKDDTFQLTIICDERLIRLTNERTRRQHELIVDLEKCPLPWKPYVRLFFPDQD